VFPDWANGGTDARVFGRKVEKREIVLASVVLLVHPIFVLIPSAITLAFADSASKFSGWDYNPGFHGSQVVYEYTCCRE